MVSGKSALSTLTQSALYKALFVHMYLDLLLSVCFVNMYFCFVFMFLCFYICFYHNISISVECCFTDSIYLLFEVNFRF